MRIAPIARHLLIRACLCVFIVKCTLSLCYADEKPLQLYEQEIKAGLVYNLLKYTIWPKESSVITTGKLQVCLFGDDSFDSYLSPLEGRTAQQNPIYIVHIAQVADASGCSVVIIHQNEEANLDALLQFVKDKNILTISDVEKFAQRGGMVEMSKEGDKISLYINKDTVSRAGLDIQARMLRLAKIVSE